MLDDARRLAAKKGFELTARGAEIRLVDLYDGLPILNKDLGLDFTLAEAIKYLESVPNRPIGNRPPGLRSY